MDIGQLKLMGELLDFYSSCRHCNKRRCRFRISLPKKISKKEMREAYFNSLQLELFPK